MLQNFIFLDTPQPRDQLSLSKRGGATGTAKESEKLPPHDGRKTPGKSTQQK
jgi:hypothetical protein